MTLPTAITTNGIGKVTTSHLNLTRTMADVEPVGYRNRFSQARPVERQAKRQRARGYDNKAPYSGAPR